MTRPDGIEEARFLEAIANGMDTYPFLATIGYGWAIREGFVTARSNGEGHIPDFTLTAKGHEAVRSKARKGE